MKFTIESYTETFTNSTKGYQMTHYEREYYEDTRILWRIVVDGKIIKNDINYEYEAKDMVKSWSYTESDVDEFLIESINNIEKECAKSLEELSLWRDKQLERLYKLQKGIVIKENMTNLFKYFPKILKD